MRANNIPDLRKKGFLLSDPEFVAKSKPASFEAEVLDWEASTLPLSYTRNLL